MKDLYKERNDLIMELRLNNEFVRLWLDVGMPESWSTNALRCAEKVKELTSRIYQLQEIPARDNICDYDLFTDDIKKGR